MPTVDPSKLRVSRVQLSFLEHLREAAMLPSIRSLIPPSLQHLNAVPTSLSLVLARELVSDGNPMGVIRELRRMSILVTISDDSSVDQINMPLRRNMVIIGPHPKHLLPEEWIERLLTCLHRGMSPDEITSAHLRYPDGSKELKESVASQQSGFPRVSPLRKHSSFLALARER